MLFQLQHPKAKEWLIAAANANYQELAKLSTDSPNLVKLQVSTLFRYAFTNPIYLRKSLVVTAWTFVYNERCIMHL